MKYALAIMLKDLRLEGRAKDIVTTTLFFAALVLLLMGFALGPDTERLKMAGAGVMWCAITFASTLAAGRAFAIEQDSGALESLLLYPTAHEWVFVGKLLANYLLMLGLGAVCLLLGVWIYDVQFAHYGYLALVWLLGILGFSVVSVFYAAITVNLRAKEALLPVLMFPVVVPVIIASVKATVMLSQNGNLGEVQSWLQLLVVFDVVSLIVATYVFPYAME